ncbi:MAG: hypothetical protein ACK4Z6_02520 [Candidatus Methylomirabilales bacterium]
MTERSREPYPLYRVYRTHTGGGQERLILGVRRAEFITHAPIRKSIERWLTDRRIPFQVWEHSSLFDVNTEEEATITCPFPRLTRGEYVDYTAEAPVATIEEFLAFLEGSVQRSAISDQQNQSC